MTRRFLVIREINLFTFNHHPLKLHFDNVINERDKRKHFNNSLIHSLCLDN